MRTLRNFRMVRQLLWATAALLVLLETAPAFGMAHRVAGANARRDRMWAAALLRAKGLPAGLTDTPDPALWRKISARRAEAHARRAAAGLPSDSIEDATSPLSASSVGASSPIAAVPPGTRALPRATRVAALPRETPDVRPLSAREMRAALGRGPLRSAYFNGTLPWQRSFHDVNLCNGDLFKSFTDVQVAPGRGAGLVLQRTYNSDDARIGPFGIGWTHAYDIRVEESANVRAAAGDASGGDADSLNEVPRTDFFGGKHTYHRDADGLYSPPAYLYDEMDSDYDDALANGPKVISDTEKGMDGTVKHFTSVLTLADGSEGNERACDSLTDRHGNVTTLAYSQTVTQADGSTRKLLTSVADPSGRSLTFHWTNLGTAAQPAYRITQIDAPTDPATNLPAYKVTYGYYTDPNESNAANDLYNLHTVTLDSDGLARTTTYTYTGCSGTYYDGSGSHSATENGLLASVSDPLGHTVSYQYDASQSFTGTAWVSQITEPGGVDAGGGARALVWTIDSAPSGGGWEDVNLGDNTYVRNSFVGNVRVACNDPVVNGQLYVQYFFVDPQLRVVVFKSGLMQYSGSHFSPVYDDANNLRMVSSSYVDLPHEAFTYGPHGNVLTQRQMGLPYDDAATSYFNASKYFAKSGVTDALGRATALDYYDDADTSLGKRGEVAWVRDAGYGVSTSPSYHKQFTYTYNQYGQKSTETNLSGVETDYTYGTGGTDKGNLTQVVQDPGAGHLARTTTMTYDVMGRVTQSTDPKGQESDFTYNSLGQPLTVKSYNASHVLQETVSYSYGGNGRTDSVTDNRGTTSFVYETGCDRVASVTDPLTGTTGYAYGLMGQRLTAALPGGGTWHFQYDGGVAVAGADPDRMALTLSGLTDDQGRQALYRYGQDGRPLSAVFGQVFDAGGALVSYVEADWAYGALGSGVNADWLSGVRTTWHGPLTVGGYPRTVSRLVSESDYTYDHAGQRLTNAATAMAPDGSGAPQYVGGSPACDGSGNVTNLVTTTRTEQYGYDDVNRLKAVDYGDGQTQGYAFDAMGNRTQRVDSVAGTTAYAFDNANRLTSAGASAYTNDADGNTLTGGGRTNTWDSQNRLVSSLVSGTSSAFTYGADGLRRSSTVTPSGGSATTTRYCYDGQTMVRSLRQNGQGVWQAAATYLTGPRGMEYRRDDLAGQVRWYVYDGLGSVVGELDPSGNLTAGKKYDVYGAERTGGTGTASSRQGYVGSLGHVTDAETGLVYMRARYYDPNTGRFISQDPALHGVNWYEYADSNPTNKIDYTGKMPAEPDAFTKLAELADLGLSKFLDWVTTPAHLKPSFKKQALKAAEDLVKDVERDVANGDDDQLDLDRLQAQTLGDKIKMEKMLQDMAHNSSGEVITADELDSLE